MKTSEVLYLSRKDVESVDLPMSEVIDALEAMFKEKGEGRVEMPPKPGIHTRKDAFIHAMPAYIPSLDSAGMKWVSGYPGNKKKNLPYISGLLILNDTETGIPITVMDATWITAQRTGAATAIAAKYLARKESSSVGILACGVQGKGNLEALACVFNITRVKAFDIDLETAQTFAKTMRELVNVDIEIVNTPREAVEGLDLVVTSGPILKNPTPAIEVDWLAEGAFASPVDYDSYWKGEALRQADKFATDDINQMKYSRELGYFKDTPQPYADLGEIVAGKKPGRESKGERAICINLGLALDDMATAILIYKRAMEKGIGTRLPL
ncbi:MAG: ornithine cyclodeaminase family protein [Deltaproteobacteria bacterium]|nr:ornithine cyclodeaminase family protein [Deltaproteobacteria bacterium]